jgi:acetyl-CoA acetyltransferase
VWRSRKRGDAGSRVWAQVDQRIDDHWKWSRPSGLLRPVDEVAMLARRYMHEYGVGRRELAEVAVAFRAWAHNNPNAFMKDRPLDVDAYLNARMISDPLCLFDNCLESDGAVAVVITSADRARTLKQPPVLIHAFSQGLCRGHQSMTDYHRDQPLQTNSRATARRLWQLADFGPDDVDVAQIYDAFSPLVWFSLEAYGFCGPGEAPHWIAERGIGPDGSAPINTSGGSLSEAYIHGLNLITEGVRQLRGKASSQVTGAETCLVTACDSTPNSALLLRRY